jgi:transcriptional regulator with XRE-family HTH domain
MEKLRKFRKLKKYSQKDMAMQLGVSASYYCKVESGYQNPSYEFLVKFKKRFPNDSVDQVFFSK